MSWEQGDYVADRLGRVWLVVCDGGMATRAAPESLSGVESYGIVALDRDHGPLMRVYVPRRAAPTDGVEMPPRTWPEAAVPSSDQLAQWLRSMSDLQLVAWCEQVGPVVDRGSRCLVRDHDRRLRELQDQFDGLMSHQPLAGVGDGALLEELRNRLRTRQPARAHGARPVGT